MLLLHVFAHCLIPLNSWYEARPEEPYPDASSAITVGLCVGQLSAVAVSLARSLTELLPLAVDSVRLAFRTGFTAITVRDELEQQFAPDESWAMTVAKGVGMVEDGLLETIQRETVGDTKHCVPDSAHAKSIGRAYSRARRHMSVRFSEEH
jgi:Starter unit:ACP transacylase in aflatoxin biosynthesis